MEDILEVVFEFFIWIWSETGSNSIIGIILRYIIDIILIFFGSVMISLYSDFKIVGIIGYIIVILGILYFIVLTIKVIKNIFLAIKNIFS